MKYLKFIEIDYSDHVVLPKGSQIVSYDPADSMLAVLCPVLSVGEAEISVRRDFFFLREKKVLPENFEEFAHAFVTPRTLDSNRTVLFIGPEKL